MLDLVVGQKVIYIPHYGEMPRIATITKVLKTRFEIKDENGIIKTRFEVNSCGVDGQTFYAYGTRKSGMVVVYTEENMKKFTEMAQQEISREKEKKERQEKARLERDIEQKKQIEEVKELYLPDDWNERIQNEILPGDQKMYVINMPIHPRYVENKGSWERLIVRIKKEESWSWQKAGMAYMTYTTWANEKSQSFSSCTGINYETEEEALWDSIRRCYFSW